MNFAYINKMLNNILFNEISVLQVVVRGNLTNLSRYLASSTAFDISSLTFHSELIAKFDIQCKPTLKNHHKYKLKSPAVLEGYVSVKDEFPVVGDRATIISKDGHIS
jgi:hypothetical protein